jgi:hypothetical protein
MVKLLGMIIGIPVSQKYSISVKEKGISYSRVIMTFYHTNIRHLGILSMVILIQQNSRRKI